MFKLSLAIISLIMKVAPPFEQFLITHTQELFVLAQHQRIQLSHTGEENFQMFALNFLCSNCLWLLFFVKCTSIKQTQGLLVCNI